MLKLIPVTALAMILAALCHCCCEYDALGCRRRGKGERGLFLALCGALILFAGLRTAYNDTDNYIGIFDQTPVGNPFENLDWTLGENPGFVLTNRMLKTLGCSAQTWLLLYSACTVGIHLWFFRKYSCNFPMTVFLFLTFCGYTFTMAAVKQCMAMALGMIAVDRAIRRRYPAFLLWLALAASFHPYALLYLAAPWLCFRPWRGMTAAILLACVAWGLFLEPLMDTLLQITGLMGENFNAEVLSGPGVHPIRLAVTAVPALLAFMVRGSMAREEDRTNYLMVNLAILNGGLLFVALFGTANYFGRLANYFLPYQALAIPWLLTHFESRSRKLVTAVAGVGYTAFFVYANAIHESFDRMYQAVPLWEYLLSGF